jgi:hypothetical protein
MTDFWLTSGFHLTDPTSDGRRVLTDDLLRAYLDRQEIRPVEESCVAERVLHAGLADLPRRPVSAAELDRLADPDTRENYAVWLDFRDRLLATPSLEAGYLSLIEHPLEAMPPLFLDQLAEIILRGLLDGTADPFRLRAAELLFRTQRATLHDGAVLLADEEVVERHAEDGGFGSLGRLVRQQGTMPRPVDLDVLTVESARRYWATSDQFDLVLDATFGRAGLDALCRVLEAWIGHFRGVAVTIQPVATIRDERWVWHVGLDAAASELMNRLYRGEAVAESDLARVLALFRLEFADPAAMLEHVAGRPVYLAMAMTPDRRVRLKPQNLLVNLPLRQES